MADVTGVAGLVSSVCEMKCNGQIFGGWTDVRIQRGLEQVSGAFNIAVTDRWPGQVEPRPIMCGDAVTVTLDGEAVVTGWVDSANAGYDENNTWFDVDGRDKTGDLVDCSAIFKTGQWKSTTIKQIAADLLAPYKIELVINVHAAKAANAPIGSFNIEDGESVHDCLDRACKIKALMMWTDGQGRLVIGLPAKIMAETVLEQGVNIKSIRPQISQAERFSVYTVKGQQRGAQGHNGKGESKDRAVMRHRPLIIIQEDQTKNHSTTERAAFEQSTRQGRGNRIKVNVQGWRQTDGKKDLWVPGLRVTLKSEYVRIIGEMLITSVTYIKNEREGTVCELELSDPRAFDRLSEQKTKPAQAHKHSKHVKGHGHAKSNDKSTEKDVSHL